jgi:tetratricopeptide (TPR) repeat protein
MSLAFLVLLFWIFLPAHDVGEALLFGAAIYVTYSFGSRYLIPAAHRRGMKAMSLKDYDTAIDQFQRSYEFFSKHYWLDKYRGITMMSPSIWSYREMALMNVASAHVAQKDFVAAQAAYLRLLEEFPQNEIASSTIEMIQATSGASET